MSGLFLKRITFTTTVGILNIYEQGSEDVIKRTDINAHSFVTTMPEWPILTMQFFIEYSSK